MPFHGAPQHYSSGGRGVTTPTRKDVFHPLVLVKTICASHTNAFIINELRRGPWLDRACGSCNLLSECDSHGGTPISHDLSPMFVLLDLFLIRGFLVLPRGRPLGSMVLVACAGYGCGKLRWVPISSHDPPQVWRQIFHFRLIEERMGDD